MWHDLGAKDVVEDTDLDRLNDTHLPRVALLHAIFSGVKTQRVVGALYGSTCSLAADPKPTVHLRALTGRKGQEIRYGGTCDFKGER